MKPRPCSGCRCLVRQGHDDDMCGWPCSFLGFAHLLPASIVFRGRWLARRGVMR